MTTWFQQPLTTLAFLWRVERLDGVTLGFTSHDRDLVRGGLTYQSAPGMVPSAIERSDGLSPDNVQLSGALTSDAFRGDDLIAGRWDGAALHLSAVDWSDPAADAVPLVRGEFGEVDIRDGAFAVGLRGPGSALDAAAVVETSPECRAEFGDRACRVDLAPRRQVVTIASVTGAVITVSSTSADGIYASGNLLWLDGANAGLSATIMASAGATVTLSDVPYFAVVAGKRVRLTEGCDRRFSTCADRFANAVNFRGEPHLPGNDLLTRYGD